MVPPSLVPLPADPVEALQGMLAGGPSLTGAVGEHTRAGTEEQAVMSLRPGQFCRPALGHEPGGASAQLCARRGWRGAATMTWLTWRGATSSTAGAANRCIGAACWSDGEDGRRP